MANSIGEKLIRTLREWWHHKWSLAISLVITLAALTIYVTTFMGERPQPIFDFVSRLELNSLDTRFQLRGRIKPDPRIVIVDIDQQSQEILGRWPFPRDNFAKLLDSLREDGARVVAFDITFTKPDETAKPLEVLSAQLAEQQKRGGAANPALQTQIDALRKQYDYDQQFADAIHRFGRVVLGNYFLYTQTDLKGVTPAALDTYADALAYFPFPRVVPSKAFGADTPPPERIVTLIDKYENHGLVPLGAESNSPVLNSAVVSEIGGTGYFNVIVDADGVVRRLPLAIPYGRDPDRKNWDVYASVDVQALRIFLNLKGDQTVLNYGPAGVFNIEFGPKLTVHPDDVSRLMVNFHGPARTYPYISFADAALHKFPPGTFTGKIVLVGASATGIGDLRVTPFGGLDFPGVEVHANLIDNILNGQFLTRGTKEGITDLAFILLFGLPLGMWLAVAQPKWMAFGFGLLLPLCWNCLLGISARLVAEFHRPGAFHARAQCQPRRSLPRLDRRTGKTQSPFCVSTICQPGSNSPLARGSRAGEASQV